MNRIVYHLDHQPQTPYREAVLQAAAPRRGGAARRDAAGPRDRRSAGRAAAPSPPSAPRRPTSSPRPRQHHVPPSPGPRANRCCRLLQPGLAVRRRRPRLRPADERFPTNLSVLALSMSGDVDAARNSAADLKLTAPLLDGSGLRTSYNVDGTPKLIWPTARASSSLAATSPAGAAKRRMKCWRNWYAAGRSDGRWAAKCRDSITLIGPISSPVLPLSKKTARPARRRRKSPPIILRPAACPANGPHARML